MDNSLKKLIRLNILVFVVWLPSIIAVLLNSKTVEFRNNLKPIQNPKATIEPTPIPTPIPTPTPTPTPIPKPARLSIPSLNIDTNIVEVGLVKETNEMEVPKDANSVGWYKYGDTPGATGSAVLTGHLDTPTGAAAIFYSLNKLQVNDEFIITNEKGDKYLYKVFEVANLPLLTFPKEKIFGERDFPQATLLTCSGIFNHNTQLYSHRLAIIGKLDKTIEVRPEIATEIGEKPDQMLVDVFQASTNQRIQELNGPYLRLKQENNNKISLYLATDNEEIIAVDATLKFNSGLVNLNEKNIFISNIFESYYISRISNGLIQISLFTDPSRKAYQAFNSENNEIKIAEFSYEKTYEGAYTDIQLLNQELNPTSKILKQTGENIYQNTNILESVEGITLRP